MSGQRQNRVVHGGAFAGRPPYVTGSGHRQGYPYYGGGFGRDYWETNRARLGANQGYGFGGNPAAGLYGGGSGLGYGGFGPYGHPYLGHNFGLGYGYGTYGAEQPAGPHIGQGPRNFQRTDDQLQDAIAHRLTQDGIDTSRIDIAVRNHEVTLTGTVDSRQLKRRVEDVAESVGGVVDIHNRLRIASTQPQR